MEADIHAQFRALREDNRILREEVREDVKGLHAKLDEHTAALNARCARRGEELAVLRNHDKERDRRVDRRLVIGGLAVAAATALINLLT
jgi:hypothetical protein